MPDTEFLTGDVTKKHLQDAAPSFFAGVPEPGQCDTFSTRNCFLTKSPGGPCDAEWLKKNPPPPDFIKKHGPPPWSKPSKPKAKK